MSVLPWPNDLGILRPNAPASEGARLVKNGWTFAGNIPDPEHPSTSVSLYRRTVWLCPTCRRPLFDHKQVNRLTLTKKPYLACPAKMGTLDVLSSMVPTDQTIRVGPALVTA